MIYFDLFMQKVAYLLGDLYFAGPNTVTDIQPFLEC